MNDPKRNVPNLSGAGMYVTTGPEYVSLRCRFTVVMARDFHDALLNHARHWVKGAHLLGDAELLATLAGELFCETGELLLQNRNIAESN